MSNIDQTKLYDVAKKMMETNPKVREIVIKYKDKPELLDAILGDVLVDVLEEMNPWKIQPVSPRTFLEDPYYCGYNPDVGTGVCETMYPILKDDFCKCHALDAPYQEVILTGGIGYGKSFIMSLGLTWHVYLLSCMKNAQKYYGLSPASKLSLMVISITEKQSKKNVYGNIKEMVKSIPYFKENFYYDEKRATESLIFPNNIEVFNGTSSQASAIGLNIFSACLDEANFFKVVEKSKRGNSSDGEFDEALALYNSLLRRQDSRFLKRGRKPGILYVGSSRMYPNDFTEQRIKIAKESQTQSTFIFDYNLWKANPDKYGDERFQVEIGGLNKRNRILDGMETDVTGDVISIPMEFKDKFVKDIDSSLRDIAGVAIYSVQPFFGQKEYIQGMFDLSRRRIFTVDRATLSPKNEYATSEKIVPHTIPFQAKPRYVAMDVGLKKDRFGFAMGYVEDLIFTEKEYMDDMTQSLQTVKTRMPIVVVEFVLEVYPEQEFGEVELSRVRFLIFQLQKFGYRIRYSSADGYQSKDMEQILKRHGIQHDYISMDKTTEPYETYRSAVYDGRVKCVYHPKLEEEMNKLERNYVLNKVDHPARGSKDLCDAVGQLVYNCHTNLHFIDEAMVPSSLVDVEESPEEDLSVYLKKFDDWVKGITKKKET